MLGTSALEWIAAAATLVLAFTARVAVLIDVNPLITVSLVCTSLVIGVALGKFGGLK